MVNSNIFSLSSIGTIRTCFPEKFGVPRQSGMIEAARGVIQLNPDPSYSAALDRLNTFSHLWILFWFHRNLPRAWRPTIEPPRILPERRLGVFASRSPHRPNPIGMSAVKLDRIDFQAVGGIEIHVSGVDILDGSPVLDIKPYLPFADRIESATAGWASAEIERYPVEFSDQSLNSLGKNEADAFEEVRDLVEEMLALDPRPTSQRHSVPMEAPESEGRRFAFRIHGFDVHWEIHAGSARVVEIRGLQTP